MDFVFNQQLREDVDQSLMNILQGFIYLADLLGPDPTGTRNVLNEQVVQWTAANQKATILNAIKRKDVGHFFFKGHGDADLFGSGDDTPFQEHIDIADLRLTLTNSFNTAQGTYAFNNPKRYVEIDGCNTGEGDLPLAFGIPKFRIDGRPNVKRRSYFGWIGTIEETAWENRYTDYIRAQNAIWHEPTEMNTIVSAVAGALLASNGQIQPNEVRIVGSRLLTWAQAQ